MIALPALLFIGLPPAQALATNKLQGSFGTFSSSLYFIRSGLVNLRSARFMIHLHLCRLCIRNPAGTEHWHHLSQQLHPPVTDCHRSIFLLAPGIRDESATKRIGEKLFALTVGFGAGFYDGFFGPGAGTFFAVGFVGLLALALPVQPHTPRCSISPVISHHCSFHPRRSGYLEPGPGDGCGQLIGGRLGQTGRSAKGHA